MELHSEVESFRRVLLVDTPDGKPASVIVARRRNNVWLVFDGARQSTAVMTAEQAGKLMDAIACALPGNGA